MQYDYKEPLNAILLRYSETGVKGHKRQVFEDQLLANISDALQDIPNLDFFYDFGRFALIHEDGAAFSREEIEAISTKLRSTFGLESFSPGFTVDSDWDSIREKVMANFPAIYHKHVETCPPDQLIQYGTRARRSFKKFPYRSSDMEILLAKEILQRYAGLKVNLDNPQLCIGIEVREESTFIFFESIKGPGGVPAGSGERILSLLAAGLKAPVACHEMMKRGSQVDYLTFYSGPDVPWDAFGRMVEMIKCLDPRQSQSGKYFVCNLAAVNKLISQCCRPGLRSLLLRRVMVRVATVLARCLKSKALLTGESIGPVAKYSLQPMDFLNRATDMLILRPLLCYDKSDLELLASEIGTLAISSEVSRDKCLAFMAGRSTGNANMFVITQSESQLDMDEVMRACLRGLVLVNQQTMEVEPYDKSLRIFDKIFAGRWAVSEENETNPD